MLNQARTVFFRIFNLEETELFITFTPNCIHFIIFGIQKCAYFRIAMSILWIKSFILLSKLSLKKLGGI